MERRKAVRLAAGGEAFVMESLSPQDTWELGKRLGKEAEPGCVICLDGDLGAGKTVFTQGFAAGLGIREPVNSPTFTILKEYEDGRLPLYHFDVYRIGDISEMDEIGYEDCFYGDGVCLVEWPSRIEKLLPKHYVSVSIEQAPEKGFDYRKITVEER
ncbi:MAG: tRNA (adenosine(37)-N6)-threonylcarbamoyltransferase complex ATPase subunit type 1 TsaE [Lachnospiraceae bacterium]|jgi:tRNA threonylcarbamoyladenosine biosynthesis protein TsaE|nr:tRNA (adenosine(37)-N6)-threonylcarbamoyltransferase complex ATPase subunit type 1 TsaE [Lachnospiraceae bacterium]NBJ83601.1 tRNA (adenosine(37)-N6)-threonylcarbamoyltransferase complex ATPase subunit type 1 TsaE [bacterium 1XD42-76]NBK06885.1 tRNA (adenosine(37)-N6)-threonylcarbamoyltransferase complex ATPase subunit type 1 TsaE [bacterium 1XD42-94]